MNYVIIGNGPAGVHAIESIRQRDPNGTITLISKEDTAPYSRIMLPELVSGEIEDAYLYYRGTDFYERYAVNCKLGKTVAEIVCNEKKLVLKDGETICYDKLLIASGSSPVILPFAQNPPKGVFSLWNKADAQEIREYLAHKEFNGNPSHIVIVGGGLVGLQAARALAGPGKDITLIVNSRRSRPRLMPSQLDETASKMLAEAAEKAGVRVLCDAKVEALHAADGKVTGVKSDHGLFPAQLVLVATGVRPNLDFAVGKGLDIGGALKVNEEMRCNIPDIFAAGDVAEAFGLLEETNVMRPLWLCAVQQGKIAGTNMAGGSMRYEGSLAMNSIDLFGLPIVSVGKLGGAEIEELCIHPPVNGIYKKLFLQQGKLVGFILVGDIQQAGILASKLGQVMGENYSGEYKNLDPAFYYA